MYRKLAYVFAMSLVCGLSVAQAADWDRAAYWDGRYPTGWLDNASSIIVRDGLVAAGYTLLDADQLKTWMDGHIADGVQSVVVLCRDIEPDTVVETVDPNCTLRKYLNAGGKIVVMSDIPFWNVGHVDGSYINPQTAGGSAVLGFDETVVVWDSGNTVTITQAGRQWGLTETWASARPVSSAVVDAVLATDNAGNAAAWAKFYVPGDTYRGFVRIYDRTGHPPVQNIIWVAEYPFIFIPATAPSPANGAIDVTSPLFQWTAAPLAVTQKVYFGTNPVPGDAEFQAVQPAMMSLFFYMGVLEPGAKYYWRVDSVTADGTVHPGDVWSFTVMPVKATEPSPANGATFVVVEPTLSWKAGQNSPTHDVYLGTDPNAVAAGDASVFKGNVAENSFATGVLEPSTTYYWRVDEIDIAGSKFVGDVWSFTTTLPGLGAAKRQIWWNIGGGTAVSDLTSNARFPCAPDITDEVPEFRTPPNIGDNYGGRLAAWLHVPVAGDYTFWVASDDNSQLFFGTHPGKAKMIAQVTSWTDDQQWDWYAEQKSATMTLDAGVYFIEALWKEGGGGDNCSAAWEGPGLPRQLIGGGYLEPSRDLWAVDPSPADGATGVYFAPELTWTGSCKATAHDVYFGSSESAVTKATTASKEYKGRQAAASFKPGDLTLGKTYFWRVDEVNEAEADSPWTGAIWSFKVSSYSLIDDFESYEFPPVAPKASIGWWKFDGDATDSSGKGHDGTVNGEPNYVDGMNGQAIHMDGTDDFVVVGSVGISGTMPRTIAGWLKADTTNIVDWTNIFGFTSKPDGGCDLSFDIDKIGGASQFCIHCYCFEVGYVNVDLEWHHMAATYDGTTIRWYAEGTQRGSQARVLNTQDNVQMGKRGHAAGGNWPGLVDDVRIYDYALSQLEIEKLAGYVPAHVLSDAWAGDKVVSVALSDMVAHTGDQSLKVTYNTRVVPCIGGAFMTPPYADLTRGGANAISLWVLGDPRNYTDWLAVAVADTGGAMFVATYKDMTGLSSGEWMNWTVPLQVFSANGVKTTSVAKIAVGALAGRPGPGTFYVDDIRLVKK